MKTGKENSPTIVSILRNYRPRLHCHSLTWKFPERKNLKCNIEGACRGNPGIRALALCIRDEKGDLICAEAIGLGENYKNGSKNTCN